MSFPAPGHLCEACGYPLAPTAPAQQPEVTADQACPECGTPLSRSNPANRTGLPWDRRFTPAAFLRTLFALSFHPLHSARQHAFHLPNTAPRLFLLLIATLCSLYTTTLTLLAPPPPLYSAHASVLAPLFGLIAFHAIFLLAYTEALGVTFFARRRKWRVPFRHAERLVLYAAPGWIPATVLTLEAIRFLNTQKLQNLLGHLGLSLPPRRDMLIDPALLLYAVAFGVAVLAFESLVWAAVRTSKFANLPAVHSASGSTARPAASGKPPANAETRQ
ncbi:MAG: hypothetical protein AAGI68_11705 [Planctomycetota bacterium]